MKLKPKKDWYKGGWHIWAEYPDGSGEYKWSNERFLTRKECLERILQVNE